MMMKKKKKSLKKNHSKLVRRDHRTFLEYTYDHGLTKRFSEIGQ